MHSISSKSICSFRILPLIAQESDLAIHGGTAINLFCFNMPRLSVDIDLTYLPFVDRDKDLQGIENILLRLKDKLYKSISEIHLVGPKSINDEYKLFCSYRGNEVKLEVNTINRGVYRSTKIIGLCAQAQEQFNVFCEAQIVPMGQLFGGKIVAALDRQHPRDIFDVKNIMEVFGLSNEIAEGVVFCMLSSKRPLHELLNPSFIDHRATLESQFSGMTNLDFTYETYLNTRNELVKALLKALDYNLKDALIEFANGEPTWKTFDYGKFPGIQWKLLNIQKLKVNNPSKHQIQLDALLQIFNNF